MTNFSGCTTQWWSTSSSGWQTISYSISTNSLSPNTEYYLAVYRYSGNNSELSGAGNFTATVNYNEVNLNTISKPVITNHRNGTFSISATIGNRGTNNALGKSYLYYKREGVDLNYNAIEITSSNSGTNIVSGQSLGCGSTTKEITVHAYSAVSNVAGSWNNPSAWATSVTVQNYLKPNAPGQPVLSNSSFRNGRLTVKQIWRYTWTTATQANGSSPLVLYRLRLYRKRNGVSEQLDFYDSSGTKITTADYWYNNTHEKYYEDGSGTVFRNNFFDIYPQYYDIKPGDEIMLGIYALAKNGNGNYMWSGGTTNSGSQTESVYTLVENAGIVRTKFQDSWGEGQVWVKMGNQWKEADIVKIKIDGTWKESE
jgi:hypothetical protein